MVVVRGRNGVAELPRVMELAAGERAYVHLQTRDAFGNARGYDSEEDMDVFKLEFVSLHGQAAPPPASLLNLESGAYQVGLGGKSVRKII
eukprot:8437799-Pyramimonas_sp.AAC.1